MLVVIGAGFAWVIWLEYFTGAWVWKIVFGAGLLVCLVSLFLPGFTWSALVGIFGGSLVWGATELPAQEQRVQSGLFRANPKRSQARRE
jgi:hypothetical protein